VASNFKIFFCRHSNDLHFKISGDFDGSSACELLNVPGKNHNGISKIFIHAGSHTHMHPFGLSVFHKNLGAVKRQSVPIVFTGEKASKMAPESSNSLS
jgi:hypothetical protein